MKEGLIALNYECSKCNERMGLYERKSAVLDGDFEWVCSTITSQNIYGRTPMILLTIRPSRLFVKIRCNAVASTRKKDQHEYFVLRSEYRFFAVWTAAEWNHVVISDKSRLNLSSDSNRVRVWRPRNERLNPAFALQRHSAPTAAQWYVHDILQPHVLSLMQRLPGAIFQQDNARPRTARTSQDCLCIVTTLPGPAQSTDLSPVEHI
ncbi:transposable element Tcb2 transposase [Trichonephila clavipes]|nr:transposable element Tcb2 transposase [Trichonephila clavipes]